MTRHTTTFPHCLMALCGLSALLSSGCMQQPLCPELGSCGGPVPLGSWEIGPEHPSCLEDLYIPANDPRLKDSEVPAARTPPLEPALFDWCLSLVTSGGTLVQARQPRFYYESGHVAQATLTYTDDPTLSALHGRPSGRYTLGTTRNGTFQLDFPAVCVRAFGAEEGREVRDLNMMVVGPPDTVCKQLEVPISKSGSGEGSYFNTICIPNPQDPQGCLCQFDVNETGGSTGTFTVIDAHTIEHEPYTNFPQRATFCNKGSSLELTGTAGSYLFGQKGLRTFDFVPAVAPPVDPCANGAMDGDETGVDCGGSCPTACP